MTELPPDLSRLGDELARAAERRVGERRRRADRLTRLAVTGVATVLAMAVMFPGALSPADRGGDLLRTVTARAAYVPNACDQPRGATFTATRPCAVPGVTDVAQLDRRYARQ